MDKQPVNGRFAANIPAKQGARHRREVDTGIPLSYRSSTVKPHEGKPQSRTVVEVTISLRYTLLEEINEGFLNDLTSTKFSEYCRRLLARGLAAEKADQA